MVYAGIVVKEYVHVRDIEILFLYLYPSPPESQALSEHGILAVLFLGPGSRRFVPCGAEADYEVFVKFRIVVEPDRNSGDVLPVFMDGFAADGLPVVGIFYVELVESVPAGEGIVRHDGEPGRARPTTAGRCLR